MGKYAEWALQDYIRGGIRWPDTPNIKRPVSHACPDCGKALIGWDGLVRHAKAKHGVKMSFSDTLAHKLPATQGKEE